jgi:RNA polymerase sigma-70 factor (ECF subfamily)
VTNPAVTFHAPCPVPWIEPAARGRQSAWRALAQAALSPLALLGIDAGPPEPDAGSRPAQPDADERSLLEQVFVEYPHGTRAFALLMERHWGRVWSVCQAILLDAHDAEETVQDVFLKVHRYLPSYRFESKFSTWLYPIARRAALTRLAERTRRRRALDDVLADPLLLRQWRPRRVKERGGALSLELREALERLDAEERLILVMHEVGGYAYEEVGAALEISPGAARMRAMRARQRLRAVLDR